MTAQELIIKMDALYTQLHDLQTLVEKAGELAYLAHDSSSYQEVLKQACHSLAKAADHTFTAANYLVRHRIIKGETV